MEPYQIVRVLMVLLGACAVVALCVLLGMALLLRRFPPPAGSIWRRRYSMAVTAGAAAGAFGGVCLTLFGMASREGAPWPWNYLALSLSGLVGGLILGLVFVLPVAMAHGVWWLATFRARRAAAAAPNGALLP